MAIKRLIAACILAGASIGAIPLATAQIAPGIVTPQTKVDGLLQAHIFACTLASSGRPVPGVNMDAPDLMGEGLTNEDSAPEWLSTAVTFADETTFARLETGEGDVWIAFETNTNRCTLGTETDDASALRPTFEEKAFARGNWKKKKDKSAVGYHYRMKIGGTKFRSEYPELAASNSIFAVQMITE